MQYTQAGHSSGSEPAVELVSVDADEEDDEEEEDAIDATEATDGGGGGGCTGVEDIRDRSMGAGSPEGGPAGDTAGETARGTGGTGGGPEGPEGGTAVLPSWLNLLLPEPNSGLRMLAMLNLRAPIVGTGGEAHLGRSQQSSGSWSGSVRGLPGLQGLPGCTNRGGVSEPTLSTSSSSSSSAMATGGPCGGPCGG